jgi:aerobic carbon-monoxide dehydrogenase medium subunit
VRGTFCGNLAHADPASEWCLVAAALDAEFTVASRRGTRILAPGEFFIGALTTALEPDELLTREPSEGRAQEQFPYLRECENSPI